MIIKHLRYTGAGIGGGLNGNGGTIIISGGVVNANATYTNKWYTAGPSAIGGGYTGKGGTVTIENATVTASGDVHAIGGGSLNNEHGCDAISVSNSTMILSFADEEGTNYHEEIKNLDISATEVAALIGSVPAITADATSFSGIAEYQWYVSADETDGYPLYEMTDQTSRSVSFLMTSDYIGQYVRCTLTNVYGNSAITSLVQLLELSFIQQPTSIDASVGDLTTLSVVSSCANVTYQWQKSIDSGETWNNIANGSNSILGISASLNEDGAQYRCIITATNGDWLASEAATISVKSDDVTYTVFHYQQTSDGTGYVPVEKEIIPSAENTQVVAEAKEYAGFTVNTSLGKQSGAVTTDNGLALSLYYDRNTYSIQFDMNGGSAIQNIETLYGAPVTEPDEPTRYGYVFGGWYADADLTTPYEFITMPLNGATVYANWEVVGSERGIEYTINSIAIRDSSTLELLDSIPSHGFLVEVNVTNLEATTMDTIIIALYTSEGRMIGMTYLFANPQISQTLTFGAYVENEDGNVGIIKAFVLPSLGNPIPLATSLEYK